VYRKDAVLRDLLSVILTENSLNNMEWSDIDLLDIKTTLDHGTEEDVVGQDRVRVQWRWGGMSIFSGKENNNEGVVIIHVKREFFNKKLDEKRLLDCYKETCEIEGFGYVTDKLLDNKMILIQGKGWIDWRKLS
jgi:hypothetical protein